MSTALTDRPVTTAAPLAIRAVALAVRDLDALATFYREVVGLDLLERDGDRALLGAGGVGFLELRHRPGSKPRDPAAAGLYHTAFLLPARADLGRWLRHAAEGGFTLDGAADHLVSEAVYLHDPEGNGIEIYVDRPRATWRWQADQVVMANERLDMIGLRALATERWAGAPPATRIGHVHLQVGGIAEAERFYVGQLGFAVTRRWPKALFMSTGGYHHHLATNTWESDGAGRRDPDRAGLEALTLVATDRAVLAGIADRLGGADLQAGVRDPWGTLIHLEFAKTGASE